MAAIFATCDGGASWSEQYRLSQENELLGVAFCDAAHGWAVGGHAPSHLIPQDGGPWTLYSSQSGIILATTDGGATWTSQFSWSTERLYAVTFIDAAAAGRWAARAPSLRPQTAARRGVPRSSQCTECLFGVAFCDAAHGWAVGRDGAILATTDGGATWTASSTRDFAQAFCGREYGWAVGDFGVMIATTDGGDTWTAQSARPAPAAPPAGAGR